MSLKRSAGSGLSIEYEQCQIVWDCKIGILSSHEVWFWAQAIGPKGMYSAGESPHYEVFVWWGYRFNKDNFAPYSSHSGVRNKAQRVHTVLVNELVSKGWEPVAERGKSWWGFKFRRKVAR